MKILRLYPLATGAACFLAIMFFCMYKMVGFCLEASIASATVSLSLAAVSAVISKRAKAQSKIGFSKKSYARTAFALAVIFFFSSFAFLLSYLSIKRLEGVVSEYDGKSMHCEYIIEDVTYYDRAASASIILTSANGKECDLRASALFFGSELPEPFTVAEGVLEFSDIIEGGGLSGRYELSKGCLLFADVRSFEVTGEYSEGISSLIGRLRINIRGMFSSRLDDNAAGLMTALFTADRTILDGDVYDSFGDLGISHLLAVSGMHLSVLAGFAGFILRKLRVSLYKRYAVLSALVILYAAVTAFAPSMLRSAGMLLLFYSSFLLGRKSHAVTSLFFSVFLICALSPFSIFDAGLLMSFSATLGIIAISSGVISFLEKQGKLPSAVLLVLSSFIVTIGATIAVIPVLCALSGRLYLPILLSNLLFSPVFTLLLFMIPLFLITYPIGPLSAIVSFFINAISDFTVFCATLLSSLPDMSVSLAYDFVPVLIFAAIVCTAALALTVKKHQLLKLIPSAAFFLLFFICLFLHNGALSGMQSFTYFCDDDNEALIFTDADDSLIIDFSTFPSSFLYEETQALSEISPSVECGTLMFTRFTSRHYSALLKLLSDSTPECIMLPDSCEYIKAVSEAASPKGVDVVTYSANDEIFWNGIGILTFGENIRDAESDVAGAMFDICGKSSVFVKKGAVLEYDVMYGVLKGEFDLVIAGADEDDSFSLADTDTDIFVSPNTSFPEGLPADCTKISGESPEKTPSQS